MSDKTTKWEKTERRFVRRNADRGSVGAWCYRCSSEHRWVEPCTKP